MKRAYTIYRKVYAADGTRISDTVKSGFKTAWEARRYLRELCDILSRNPDNDCTMLDGNHLYSKGAGNRYMFIISI